MVMLVMVMASVYSCRRVESVMVHCSMLKIRHGSRRNVAGSRGA